MRGTVQVQWYSAGTVVQCRYSGYSKKESFAYLDPEDFLALVPLEQELDKYCIVGTA